MEIQKGEWYFSVQCKACNATIYFSHDPSRGTAEIAAHENASIELACPACRTIEEYDRSELLSREAKYA